MPTGKNHYHPRPLRLSAADVLGDRQDVPARSTLQVTLSINCDSAALAGIDGLTEIIRIIRHTADVMETQQVYVIVGTESYPIRDINGNVCGSLQFAQKPAE
jgi:hypothetical protein